MSSTAAKTPCIDLDEDLEDGEIDDDDDDEVVVQQSLPLQQQHQQQQKQPKSADEDVQFVGIESLNQNIDKSKDDDVVFLGQSGEGSNNTIKTKKPRPLEDDHAVSIENAIANALKKRGIEPPMPKMRSMYNNSTSAGGRDPNDVGGGGVGVGDDGESGQYLQQQTASRNSRRRKRKKERERKQKKDKDHQKRARHDDEEETPGGAAAGGAASDEMDMDEYEMMNVRGGSPPPGGATVPGNPYMGGDNGPGAAGGYDSLQDYYSSYDSYSDDDMAGGGMNQRRRQRHDRDKDNQRSGNSGRKRRDRDQDRRHDAGGGNAAGGAGSNKRNRRDSGDGPMNNEKMMRTEPRKLELCKFYLMDCCAKRDKCSYMHKEFPCKYYYLGMECYAGEDCLFHHGEPLSEQLRNILLKHMETAPKEILGDFKRIGRDVALAQMTRRHEQLCEQYGRDNSWTTMASAGIGRRRPGDQGQQDQQQQQLQQQLQQQQQLLSTSPLGGSSLEGVANQLNNTAAGQQLQQQLAGGQIIPSLLDMVINRPQINESKTEKKRKSRWAEKTAAKAAAAAGATGATATTTTTAATSTTTRSSNSPAADIVTGSSNLPPATTAAAAAAGSKSLPPHLDLVNLTNVLSAEHMAKLNKLGITNLEQMLEVPFGQLTEVGLTLNEIGEIQQKAEAAKPTESKALTTTTTTTSTTNSSSSSINPPAKSETTEANSNSNSNGFIMVDYTQYLKDAHVNFSANDPLDDDRDDDEQLVIDDGNDESAAEEEPKVKSTKPEQIDNETPPLPSVFDLPSFMSNMIGGGANKAPEHQAAETADDDKKANKDGDDGTGAAAAPSTSSSLFSRILFGEKQPDPEARAAFYRDIIRNPFKAHQGDIGDDQPNENSNSNSRSMTPTPTPTPEPGSQSPQQLDEMSLPPLETPTFKSGGTQQSSPLYARTSMYDFDSTKAEQQLAALQKANDQASNSERDIDMRLPFEPMKHYMPATEIDAAIFSHTPLRWQLQEVDVEEPNYVQLRLSAAHKEQRELRDPRVRRILGLTELTADGSCGSGASGGGGASANLLTNSDSAGRGSGNTISSPDSVIMSPMARDTTPTSPPPSSSSTTTTSSSATSQVFSSSTKMVLPAMNVPPPTMGIPPPNLAPEPQVRTDPRRDPRRAHLNASSNTANTSNSSSNSSSSISTNSSSTSQTNPSGGSKQILEIRNLMQSSNWYKNLGSNNKIMVNQQLALVFTELKKFHQQEGNNKIFDLNFIVNNSTLQQIFAKLYIYIDDMGQVVQLPEDLPTQGVSSAAASSLILPNLSQPPPNMVQMLRQPPPNMCGNAPGGGLIMQMGMPPPTVVFNQPPPSRPRLLGMGPGGGNGGGGGGNGGGGVGGGMPLGNNNNNLFNPFSGGGGGNGGNMGMGMPFMNNGGGGGGMPYKNFNNNGGGPGGNGGGNGGGGHHHFSGGGNNRNQRGNGPRNHRNNI